MAARRKRKATGGKVTRKVTTRKVSHRVSRQSVVLVDSIPVVKTLPYHIRVFLLVLFVLLALSLLVRLV